MELSLKIYLTRPSRSHFEASIPWFAPLAAPVRGPSAAQLKEELMFRVLELVDEGLPASELDRLIAPDDLHLLVVYAEFERVLDPRRPPVQLNGWTHVICGKWPGDERLRVWAPRMGTRSYRAEDFEEIYQKAPEWIAHWADEHEAESLVALQSPHYALIDGIEVDVDFSSPPGRRRHSAARAGRLRRPEVLQQVATNLLHRAEDGNLPPAYGREGLTQELVNLLSGTHGAHICLVGPGGVGKSALIQEAARRVAMMGRTYQSRRDLWKTSGDRIIAGMSIIGQWEQRAEQICDELASRGDILVVDDLLGLVRAGRTQQGESNLARFIEPYLEQGRFGLITEATEQTWEMARELAPGFVDKFRRIQVPELDYGATLAIVGEQVRDLESYHGIRFTPDGLEAILHHSRRFFRQEAFPGKAIGLVKQCFNEGLRRFGSHVEDFVKIDSDLVADVLHRQTGLPLSILRQDRKRTPETIAHALESKVFGQPDATGAMTRLIVTLEQGLSQPGRPLGTFLLIGPSGVGKTETARALAQDLFGSTERMIRFDMSEFGEALALTRLIGTPNRPDGELTGKVRLQPFSVLLFDEIEKAHPRVLDLLLQVLGDGRLTDAAGRTVDFCNTVIMMTSNLGAENEERWLGFADQQRQERMLHYRRSAEQFFRPELFNRIDQVIAYRPLEKETLRRIGRRTVRELIGRRGLRQGHVVVDISPSLVESLAMRSVDRRYGARTLGRRIEQELITPLARELTRLEGAGELTLVTMRPGLEQGAVDLRVAAIPRAPHQGHVVAEEDFETVLGRLVAGLEELESLPQTSALFAEYDQILASLNAEAARGGWSEDLSEGLRHREMLRSTLERLRSRLDGLLDPELEGRRRGADDGQFARASRQNWTRIATQIEGQLIWARAQLNGLLTGETESTLWVLRAIAAPAGAVLQRWHRWCEGAAQSLDLQLQWVFSVGDRWQQEPRWESVEAIALVTDCPGARALFSALDGYVWIPGPQAAGLHVLLEARCRAVSWEGEESLPQIVARSAAESARVQQGQGLEPRFIELIEQDGTVEDVRLARHLPMPEDRGRAAEFMVELLCRRVQLLSNDPNGSIA
jgi:ATP-dependent Clp protease ATP-binding subunit ClpC